MAEITGRGFSNHYLYEDLVVNPGETVQLTHGLGHEPDVGIFYRKAGDRKLVVNYVDDKIILLNNPSATEQNISNVLLEYYFSTIK